MSEDAAPVPAGSGFPGMLRAARTARVRYLLAVVALGAMYYGAAKLGYVLEFAGPVAAILWLPAGVGIAFIYLGGPMYWPGVLVGDLLANDYSALPLGSALGQTCGNMLEVLVAALLIRRLVPRGSPLESISGLGGMLVAIAVGVAVSATIGSLSLRLGDVIRTDDVPHVWRTWWLGDFSGALVVVPLAVAWLGPRQNDGWNGRALEATILLALVAGLSLLAFRSHSPVSYLVFPALIWTALRLGQRGATLAIVITVLVTVWNTTNYEGPFVFDSITRSVLTTQLYIAVAALSTLCLAAVVSEREKFAAGLSASRIRLVEAADTERRRLERNLHDGAQQRLTALVVRLGLGAEQARQDPERIEALLRAADVELALAIEELRDLAHGIHPTVLTDFGLASAVKSLAVRSTVPVKVLELPSGRFDEAAESTAYYVLAEGITNAQKYADASSIQVRAVVVAQMLSIEVRDDGIGGAAESVGSGLRGLRDRVEAIGGTFRVDSRAGRGTRLAASIPATAAPESRNLTST